VLQAPMTPPPIAPMLLLAVVTVTPPVRAGLRAQAIQRAQTVPAVPPPSCPMPPPWAVVTALPVRVAEMAGLL